MKPWQQVLREHDPIEPLTADEAEAIRRVLIREARSATATAPPRLVPILALGSALVVAVISGLMVARAHPETPAPSSPSAPGDLRQLQFTTPGGTRIIWQFNPDFSLRESHP